MIAIETVLCPVDFSPATPRQVDVAAELCRTFNARLVLHHNRHSLGSVASVGWMWNADHQGDSQTVVEAKLRDCLSRVPEGVSAEPLMTEGPPLARGAGRRRVGEGRPRRTHGARNAGRRPRFDHAAGYSRTAGARCSCCTSRRSSHVRHGSHRNRPIRRSSSRRPISSRRRVKRWSWGST